MFGFVSQAYDSLMGPNLVGFAPRDRWEASLVQVGDIIQLALSSVPAEYVFAPWLRAAPNRRFLAR